jgi:tetratricopeptide (TPR) repeat protein
MQRLVLEAIDEYRKVSEVTPDDPWAWRRLGDALQTGGEHTESIAALREAIELKPDYVGALYGLGKAYAALGNRTQLMATYEALRTLHSALADEFFEEDVFP